MPDQLPPKLQKAFETFVGELERYIHQEVVLQTQKTLQIQLAEERYNSRGGTTLASAIDTPKPPKSLVELRQSAMNSPKPHIGNGNTGSEMTLAQRLLERAREKRLVGG